MQPERLPHDLDGRVAADRLERRHGHERLYERLVLANDASPDRLDESPDVGVPSGRCSDDDLDRSGRDVDVVDAGLLERGCGAGRPAHTHDRRDAGVEAARHVGPAGQRQEGLAGVGRAAGGHGDRERDQQDVDPSTQHSSPTPCSAKRSDDVLTL